MKQLLEEKSMKNFLKVVETSLAKSYLSTMDVDDLAILHMKKSEHDYVLQELGLSSEQSVFLEEYGHNGQFGQVLSLVLALERGR